MSTGERRRAAPRRVGPRFVSRARRQLSGAPPWQVSGRASPGPRLPCLPTDLANLIRPGEIQPQSVDAALAGPLVGKFFVLVLGATAVVMSAPAAGASVLLCNSESVLPVPCGLSADTYILEQRV